MPNVNIYIPEKYVQPLSERLREGESLGVGAKRLLLKFLDGHDLDSMPELESPELEAITERLSRLEQSFQDFLRQYVNLEDNLNDLAPQVAVTQARLSKLEEELKQAPGRSQSKRDSNGRFTAKGEKDAEA